MWPSSYEHGLRSVGMVGTPSSAWLDSPRHATPAFFSPSLCGQNEAFVSEIWFCWIVIEYVEGREHRVPSVNVFAGHDYSVVGDNTALINSSASSNPKYWTWDNTELHGKSYVLFWHGYLCVQIQPVNQPSYCMYSLSHLKPQMVSSRVTGHALQGAKRHLGSCRCTCLQRLHKTGGTVRGRVAVGKESTGETCQRRCTISAGDLDSRAKRRTGDLSK